MDKMGKYCCFTCPRGDFTEKSLTDPCPHCGRAYGFPLHQPPTTIESYKVLRPLQRGFYGAAYNVERLGTLKTKHVLKVIPVELYSHFNKNFEAESAFHATVAANADHVVGISDVFDADVDFCGTVIRCHIAVLEYLDGYLLGDFLRGEQTLSAGTAAQIAADLFRMKSELERHLSNHNDLHADNIIVHCLTRGMYRQGAMDPTIRAVAIDLGSVGPDRRSGDGYFGDLHWITKHIQGLVDRLLIDLEGITDLNARVAHALQLIAQTISPAVEHQRTPTADDFVRNIEREYFRTAEPWRPWREQLKLRTFGTSYNAQTLDAWHVPQLLVDPDGAWLAQISAPGPLVVTGMRGCGKTLLLRAIQFHARAARQGGETDADVLLRLKKDNYVGLFVSAQRLLDVEIRKTSLCSDLFARLYVAYALEAARALAHLFDLDPEHVARDGHIGIANAVQEVLQPNLDLPDLATIEQLERYLVNLLIRVSRTDSAFALAAHPSNAFPILAGAIRRASPIWTSAQILFQLDDVSTRYMEADRIEYLLSALIFQHPECAFKVTSEAQTIFLTLKSPGQVNPAAAWRDFQTFDLGANVHARLRQHHVGKKFVEDILSQRAQFYASHPALTPSQILGDVSYEEIASTIASSKPESGDRKKVYRGITALTGMCVGDIGSVISLYEDILSRASGTYPIPDNVQADAFQDSSSRHLYLLDRRGGHLKDMAKSFAEASHELLVQSARKPRRRRLRQYASIYVRVTAGDFEKQMKQLRELVDAGVFVFTGGAPRTKTRDSNPTQQFKLTYRKIYGLVNLIGLSDRDRFELSGRNLEEWLQNPADGKEILMRNLSPQTGNYGDADDDAPGVDPIVSRAKGPASAASKFPPQLALEARVPDATSPAEVNRSLDLFRDAHLPFPEILPTSLDAIAEKGVDNLVLGLGFEKRTAISARHLLAAVKPNRVIAVSYDEPGRREDIISVLEELEVYFELVEYSTIVRNVGLDLSGFSLIDITGLAKPVIFNCVRSALRRSGEVSVAYTEAEQYYPLDADLERVLAAERKANHHELLLSLKEVLMGEQGPYRLVPLLPVESDGTRMRSLCAFASSKHERLLHLVETRDYDHMDIMVDDAQTERSRVAEIAAEVAVREDPNASISRLPYQDPTKLLQILGHRYEMWYVREGLNFEIGLTGNKLQAVAAAVLCGSAHVNQVWYVSPAEFDKLRFTTGVGTTECFSIRGSMDRVISHE